MNEDDFRASLHNAYTNTTPPSPMSTTTAIRAGRRANRRRLLATSGAAVAVTAVVTAVAVSVSAGSGAPSLQVGAPSSAPTSLPAPGGSKAEIWPTGPDGQPQQDRTAKAGHRFELGQKLLSDLVSLVPSGYTVPDNPGTDSEPSSRMAQAQFEERVNNKDLWSYLAVVDVVQGGKAGTLLVTVYEPGLRPTSGDMCAVASGFWTQPESCEIITTPGGQTVGLATGKPEDGYGQWAAYRHTDGTVVFVAQSQSTRGPGGGAGLDSPPLSTAQLAAAASDARFHLIGG